LGQIKNPLAWSSPLVFLDIFPEIMDNLKKPVLILTFADILRKGFFLSKNEIKCGRIGTVMGGMGELICSRTQIPLTFSQDSNKKV
jgi:hypothetical protein